MNGNKMKRLASAACLMIILATVVYSQSTFEKGMQHYEQENYTQALQAFERLLNEYPKDPEYNYYAGMALYHLGSDWPRCLEYLKNTQNNDIHPKQQFYFGRIYLNLIQPDKAYLRFLEYKSKRPRFALDNESTEHWISATKNVKEAIEAVAGYKIVFSKLEPEKGYKTYNHQGLPTGSWVTKDELFFIEAGIKSSNAMIFQPSLLHSGEQCIFLSGSKGIFNTNSDIYKYCESDEVYEKQISALPKQVNSAADEIQAVFDPANNLLYFSSNKEGGYGGYDIYKCEFNPGSGTWGVPVNLGFPVNSPFDEFFLGPGTGINELFIATNRYTNKGTWRIVGLQINYNETMNLTGQEEALLLAANFNTLAMPLTEKGDPVHPIRKIKDEIAKTQSEYIQYSIDETAYNQVLEKALDFQLKADSIHRLADEQRYVLSAAETQTKRMEAIRKIEAYESEADVIQKQADIEFAKARKMELAAEQDVKVNSSQQKNRNNSETQTPVIDKTTIKERLSNQKTEKETIASGNEDIKSSNSFAVHATSVYSAENPFDMEYSIGSGLIYRIQLGVFSKPIAYNHFGGIWPITGEELVNRGMKKYYAGLFSHRSEAEKALFDVRKEGFSDAFVVAWFNGKKVSLNRASDIENTLYNNSSY